MNITNKVVIVTGASAGIGLATARLLSERGAQVALVARSRHKLETLSRELPGSLPVTADMSKPDEIKKMVRRVKEHYGRVDGLVNNAGQGYDALVQKIDTDTFQKIFALDLVGPLVAMQEVIPLMREQNGGAIVNVSSGTALMILPLSGPYASLKKALSHLSLIARQELAPSNISVSVVYPYITITDFELNTIKEGLDQEAESEEEGGGPPFPPDPPELVAEKILEALVNGEAEILLHDWMRDMH
jgi:short-subunit dehydrogenase